MKGTRETVALTRTALLSLPSFSFGKYNYPNRQTFGGNLLQNQVDSKVADYPIILFYRRWPILRPLSPTEKSSISSPFNKKQFCKLICPTVINSFSLTRRKSSWASGTVVTIQLQPVLAFYSFLLCWIKLSFLLILHFDLYVIAMQLTTSWITVCIFWEVLKISVL